ncbi:MAG: hypothetical protein CM15mP74_33600 [Halieaceae bacterium]|nr:MAG: hypothetical protein CM15mP74_33600 [Halieaceae bacterium]
MPQPVAEDDGQRPAPDIWMKFKERYGVKRISEFYGSAEGQRRLRQYVQQGCPVGATSAPTPW